MAQPVHSLDAVPELRELLERRFPDSVPVTYRTAGGIVTGVEALDRVLPAGGFPRGALTTWTDGAGASAVVRAACGAAVSRGERAAWVDGAGVVAGESWRSGPILIRPPDRTGALKCVEVLLRSGGFALVALSGASATDTELVRLSRVAREGGAALVVVGVRSSAAALRIASRIPPEGYHWRSGPFGPARVEAVTVRTRARAMGLDARTEFSLPVMHHDIRLSLEPELADRRGTPPRPR